MKSFTLRELASATGGKLLGSFREPETRICNVLSDNREVRGGEVFFAFVGEKIDAHRFVESALEAGAAGCVISREQEAYRPDKFYLLVPDTVEAFGALAAWHRRRFAVPVVAVTGSVGKTTTKEMIASVLSVRYRVLRTQGNFNNEIGVPKTLFGIDDETQIAVVEMGMNHPGEIDRLTRWAAPQAAVITNVGEAHIGILGSRENIYRAKTEIFNGLEEGGLAVLNGDDDFLPRLLEDGRMAGRWHFVWVGESGGCDYRAEQVRENGAESVSLTAVTPKGSYALEVPAAGRHMLYPAMTAAAVGEHFGLSSEEIARGIAAYVPAAMRMEILRCPSGITIYNDTYNANPQSMLAGLRILAGTACARRVAVLGDMFELGAEEERLHREVGAAAGKLPLTALVTIGRAAAGLAEAARESAGNGAADACVQPPEGPLPAREQHVGGEPGAGAPARGMTVLAFADKEGAERALSELVQPDTAFLVKASRGMKLEEISAFLKEQAQARYRHPGSSPA